MKKFIIENKKNSINIALIVFVSIIYIGLMFSDSIWGDEGFTMSIVKKSFTGIIEKTAEDVHPPLYYIIVKILTIIFGYSTISVRLASILPVILIMIFVMIKSKKLFGKKWNISILLISLIFAGGFEFYKSYGVKYVWGE